MAPFGPIRRNKLGKTGVVSPLYFRINNASSDFMEYYFKSNKWYRYIYWVGDTGARADRVSIKKEIFLKMPISIPCEKEQEKISNSLIQLSKLIDLYERKIKLLELLDKELENKIYNNNFIKKNTLTKITLNDILNEKHDKSTIENQYPLLSSTNSGIELRSGRTKSNSNVGYKILDKNNLVLSPQNLWLGNININFDFKKGIVSPSYKIFKVTTDVNLVFLNTILHHPQMMYLYKMISVQGASIVRRNLDLNEFKNIKLNLPPIEIQNKLGNLIKEVDQLTSYLKNMKKQLTKIKHSLLNTMFI